MQIFKTIAELQTQLKQWRHQHQRICLVPTMGGLHPGHLALVNLAKKRADRVLVSIFVNTAQFAENEDFDTYPRDLKTDLELLHLHKTSAVFLPDKAQIYPDGIDDNFDVGELGKILCGKTRPHFFVGVAQVVKKLFEIIEPDSAIFGQKDYQQLFVIKQMVRQYALSVEIIAHETVRENNGLAMSTRNQYLSFAERKMAANFYKILHKAKENYAKKQSLNLIQQQVKNQLKKYFIIDYVEILDANNLKKITDNTTQIILLSAVYLGENRLIDNIKLGDYYA